MSRLDQYEQWAGERMKGQKKKDSWLESLPIKAESSIVLCFVFFLIKNQSSVVTVDHFDLFEKHWSMETF